MDTTYQVDREDLVLLLLDAAERYLGVRELRGVTRLEKLLFLLGREEHLESAEKLYEFQAYKFGPFSKDVYQATDFLRGIDFIEIQERPVASYYNTTEEVALRQAIGDEEDDAVVVDQKEKVFKLTDHGRTAAHSLRDIWEKQTPANMKKLDDVIKRYGKLPLNQLIRYVYRQFPDWARNSIHPEAGRLSGA
jgi:antitoxin SocA-like protein